MWLTNKKTGTHFNTDWIDEDIDTKEKQIAANKKEADKLNGKDSLVDKINTIKVSDFDNTDRIDLGEGNYIKKRDDGRYTVHFETSSRSGSATYDTADECIKRLKQIHKIKGSIPKKIGVENTPVEETENSKPLIPAKDDFYRMDPPKEIGNKQKPFDVKESAKKCNPRYKDSKEPYYKWHQNCQRTVIAYEMRRRGYDVKAKPKESEWDSFGNINTFHNYTQCFVTKEGQPINNLWVDVGANSATSLRSNVITAMKYYGDGSRVMLRYKHKNVNTGHVMIVENEGGNIRFINPQSGSINAYDIIKYGDIDYGRVKLVRIDDKKFTNTILTAVERR